MDSADSAYRPSPLAMAVLCLLVIEPLHPYAMQRLIKLWGKDQVVNVGQRANLYKTIKRLHAAGLIEVLQTERDQQFPERTVYRLTEQGREVVPGWLAGMLAAVRNEFPQFPAALSFAMLLAPDRLREILEQRAAQLRDSLARSGTALANPGMLPRVTLLDEEYQRAVTAAELDWVTSVTGDLRTGKLTWNQEELAAIAMSTLPGLARPARSRARNR